MKDKLSLEEIINHYLKGLTLDSGITYRVHADLYELPEGKEPRVYVQLASRIAVCCSRGHDTQAPWELVRGGVIWEEAESRCSSCGLNGIGWLTSMTRQIYGQDAMEIRDRLDELLVLFESKVMLERLSKRDAKLRDLTTELKFAAQALKQTAKAIEEERGLSAHEAIAIAAMNVATGSPDKPGIFVSGNQLINWAVDPGSWPVTDERIEVRVPLT